MVPLVAQKQETEFLNRLRIINLTGHHIISNCSAGRSLSCLSPAVKQTPKSVDYSATGMLSTRMNCWVKDGLSVATQNIEFSVRFVIE